MSSTRRISAKCRCCDNGEDETILHILRCWNRTEVHKEYEQTCIQQMREFEAPNHLLYLFETSINLALINADAHIGEDWNRNCVGSMTEMTVSDLLNDDTTPQHFKMAFKQQTMIVSKQLFMGMMARAWRQCWLDKTYRRSSIVYTFMDWAEHTGGTTTAHCTANDK